MLRRTGRAGERSLHADARLRTVDRGFVRCLAQSRGRASNVTALGGERPDISIHVNGRLEQKAKRRLGMHNRVQSNLRVEGETITAMLTTL